MPETTPLIKAALNLRGGAGFDVYYDNNISLDFTHNIICMSMHTNIFNVTSDATIRFKADLFLYDL